MLGLQIESIRKIRRDSRSCLAECRSTRVRRFSKAAIPHLGKPAIAAREVPPTLICQTCQRCCETGRSDCRSRKFYHALLNRPGLLPIMRGDPYWRSVFGSRHPQLRLRVNRLTCARCVLRLQRFERNIRYSVPNDEDMLTSIESNDRWTTVQDAANPLITGGD